MVSFSTALVILLATIANVNAQQTCVDSPIPFMKTNAAGAMIIKDCAWVGIETFKVDRCSKKKFQIHCPVTCADESTGGVCGRDSPVRFEVTFKKEGDDFPSKVYKNCKWVKKKKDKRCSKFGVADTCRNTCSDTGTSLTTVPSTSISPTTSDIPSSMPSLHPSKTPSGQPSSLPSNRPSDHPSSLPSLHPSESPSDEPSLIPSLHPSESPSDEPSLIPSDRPSDIPSSMPSLHPSVSLSPSLDPLLQCSVDVLGPCAIDQSCNSTATNNAVTWFIDTDNHPDNLGTDEQVWKVRRRFSDPFFSISFGVWAA